MCRNCVHMISCNRCSIFTCGCTSCVIILFLWFRFRPRMRTIRRLLQSLHWPNLHHEFLKWVRNSAGETCSLSLSQTNFRHRGQLYDTCFTLFPCFARIDSDSVDRLRGRCSGLSARHGGGKLRCDAVRNTRMLVPETQEVVLVILRCRLFIHAAQMILSYSR